MAKIDIRTASLRRLRLRLFADDRADNDPLRRAYKPGRSTRGS
jgi:hypothetical protein